MYETGFYVCFTLRKLAYSNILKILPPKHENFQIKNSDIFHISAQNIDCGYSLEPPRRGGSNEYPQSMFLAETRKIMYTPVNPSFTIKKWGLRGSKLYRHVFVMMFEYKGGRGGARWSCIAHLITRQVPKQVIFRFKRSSI